MNRRTLLKSLSVMAFASVLKVRAGAPEAPAKSNWPPEGYKQCDMNWRTGGEAENRNDSFSFVYYQPSPEHDWFQKMLKASQPSSHPDTPR